MQNNNQGKTRQGQGTVLAKGKGCAGRRETEEERLIGAGICTYSLGRFGVYPSSKMLIEVS